MDHYILEQLQAAGFEVKAPEGFDATKLDAVIENAPQTDGLRKGLERTKTELQSLKTEREEIERAAEQAKREKLEAEGKFEELRQLDRQELEKLQSSLVKSRAESLKQQTLSLFSSDVDLIADSVEKHLKPKFENGQVIDTFEFGGNTYTNVADYHKALMANATFASKIKVPASSGAPAAGGQGNHSSTPSRGKMSAAEKHSYIQQHGQAAYLKLPK